MITKGRGNIKNNLIVMTVYSVILSFLLAMPAGVMAAGDWKLAISMHLSMSFMRC